MYQIDDSLLDELGLSSLAGQEREEFKDYIKTTLQERVGERLTQDMDDKVLDEFGFFMDGNLDGMKAWLNKNVPGYQDDPTFKQFVAQNANAGEADILSSYGSLAWLQINCPNYTDVVKQAMDELKAEISANIQAILEA